MCIEFPRVQNSSAAARGPRGLTYLSKRASSPLDPNHPEMKEQR